MRTTTTRKYSWYVTCFCLASLVLAACSPAKHNSILQREWTANAEFAGDVWATSIGESHDTALEVREGSEIIDPIKMVRTGAAQFGVASSDRVLRENENGASLVVLAAASYRSPVVFLTQPPLAINSPRDFKGRRIGIQAGTNTELVFRALIATVPIAASDMTVVESGWGITNFETKTLDVIGAFAYDEPIQLDAKEVPYHTIDPQVFGVQFVGTVYFTTRSLVDRDPKLVQSFVASIVDGWRAALDHPSEAIDMLARRFPTIDKTKELKSLQAGKPYFQGEDGKLLYASKERWDMMAKQLISLRVLKAFTFDENVNYRFLNEALAQKPKPN
jgi:ABC-type nitrate/sulfonate/bicarbonate transport system substrate-binding protein